MIPLSVPEIRGNEWRYVKECLDTNWVSSVGPFVDRFERMAADYVGTKYAVATVNGTAAIHVALMLVGVKPGEEVLVPTLTFIAPANAVRYVGAVPFLVDIDSEYLQMDVNLLVRFLEQDCKPTDGKLFNRKTGRRIAAIMPVHLLGHPVEMDSVLDVARKYKIPVVEDASESLGATYKGQPVGGLGSVGCFSFNGNKTVTTGGGGMLVTDDEDLALKARYLTTQAKDHPIEYIHNEVGFNYRLSNVLAAIGCAQMENLDEFISTKRRIRMTYDDCLGDLPGITLVKEASWARSVCWMYTILVNATEFGTDSRTLLSRLQQNGIQTRPVWQPIHLSPAHLDASSILNGTAEHVYANALSLPCSVGLSPIDQEKVLSEVKRVAEEPHKEVPS